VTGVNAGLFSFVERKFKLKKKFDRMRESDGARHILLHTRQAVSEAVSSTCAPVSAAASSKKP
jgi:hypothetical protein